MSLSPAWNPAGHNDFVVWDRMMIGEILTDWTSMPIAQAMCVYWARPGGVKSQGPRWSTGARPNDARARMTRNVTEIESRRAPKPCPNRI